MKQTKAFLFSRRVVSSDVVHLFFFVEEGMDRAPGQYAILTIPSSPTPLRRLYSFAGSSANKNVFELLVKLVPGGVASEYLFALRVGDGVDVAGPTGLFLQQKTPHNKIYMATGTGFAPIRSFLLSDPPSPPYSSSLFWGLRNISDIYLFDEILTFQSHFSSFSFTYCLSQQKSFDTIPADLLHNFRAGHIDDVWASQTSTINPEDEYYLCGSRTVIESLRLLLLSKGVQKDKLFFEKY